ncbi:MAG: hypothetical protein R3E68_01545 [Burkholderiaceae bacterium]
MKSTEVRPRSLSLKLMSLVAVVFGLLSIKEGGSVLFGDGVARAQAGQYVPFIVWFNFLAGFVYVGAGLALWWRNRIAAWLSIGIVVATVLAFAALGVFVAQGGGFEVRTVAAMALRTVIWLLIAIGAWKMFRALPAAR